jgi:hypothetical protein
VRGDKHFIYKYIFSKRGKPEAIGNAYTYQNDVFEKKKKKDQDNKGKSGGKK